MGEYLAANIGVVLAGLLLAGLFVFVVLLARRWLLERGGGTVECSLRTVVDGRPGAWRLGIARYSRDELCWYPIFGIRLKPGTVMKRRGLVVEDRRHPSGDETAALAPDAGIVALRERETAVELAMSASALVGFLAWLEAAPPGFPVNHL